MSAQNVNEDMKMGENSLDLPFFDAAIEAIHHTLSDEHQRALQNMDATTLLNELRACSDADDRNLPACSRKFSLFVQTFVPYFNVLSICTRVDPIWPSSFWSLVRLVFQVAREYTLFLEKIADVLESVACVLPPYHRIYETSKLRVGDDVRIGGGDDCLSRLMSYAFLDIVNGLLELYRIFFREISGTESRNMAFISPFPAAQWRPMDSRFAQLEHRLRHHRRWLEKETEHQVQDFTEIEHHRKAYVRLLHRHRAVSGDGELEGERMAKRMRRVDIVRGWISKVSESIQSGGESTKVEHLGSCNWFLDLAKYRAWKSRPFERRHANDARALKNDWHDRILFVQAEMGYGKSVLANAVADDLFAEAEDVENEKQHCAVHFRVDSNQSESTSPDHIFRQLVLRILQDSRHDHKTLDTTCLLLRKTSFQDTATADEVLDFLAILLRQRPTFLVIDGIEACNHVTDFLTTLASICRKADTKAIIFSRPAITIPLEYQKWASDAPHIVYLDGQHNAEARRSFVVRQLDEMADQGHFGTSLDHTLASHVVQHSEGNFLWASLFSNYLRSSALSPNDRITILQNVHLLQGLETLYTTIIKTLSRRPPQEKRIIADVFRWLSFPIHRLNTPALRTALTSSPDFTQNEHLYPTDILPALPHLTCGLVNVSHDTVSFTHPSLRAYLHSQAAQDSEFSLRDESDVHAHLTARCLTYLAHYVPKRPLGSLSPQVPSSSASYRTNKSGDSGYKSLSSSDGDNGLPHAGIHVPRAAIRRVPFDTTLPFLRYACLCWPIHLSRALTPSLSYNHHFTHPYIPALSNFLSSRLAVTAWVEASYRYGLPPTLTRLVGPLSDLKAEISAATCEGREVRDVAGAFEELSGRLVELKGAGVGVRGDPGAVWGVGGYWAVWE